MKEPIQQITEMQDKLLQLVGYVDGLNLDTAIESLELIKLELKKTWKLS